MSEKEIRLSIIGDSGSGKTTLCNWLDGKQFVGPGISGTFRMKCRETIDASALLHDTDMVLLTFPVEINSDMVSNLTVIEKWRKLIEDRYWEHRKKFIFIGTKRDMFPEERSAENLYIWSLPGNILLSSGIQCIFLSAISGFGLQELCSYVAKQACPYTESTMSTRLRTVLYHTRSALFDFLARIFALPVPPDVNRDVCVKSFLTLEGGTPEAIAHNQHLAQYWRSFGGIKALQAPAWKIAPTLIAKHISPFERDNTLFIRSHTNIPVPQPRCLHLNQVYVSEFVPGRMLLACWDSLSWFTQFRVACTLRNYVKIMRSLTRDIPGSVNGGHIYGQIFEMPPLCNGPFRTAEIFQNWFEYLTHVGWLRAYTTSSPPPVFPDEADWTPVFNHCDLNLSNILLSDDGVLWIIDWANSGFYPAWMESVRMRRFPDDAKSWKKWFSFICGGDYSAYSTFATYVSHVAQNTGSLAPREDFWPPNRR